MTVRAGHRDRAVSIEQTAGGAVVVKTYLLADAAAIFAAMCDLWASPFGRVHRHMPEPITLAESRLSMGFVSGSPIGARGDLGSTERLLDDVAQLLVRLHRSGVEVGRKRNASGLVRSLERKATEVAKPLGPAFARAVGHVNSTRLSAERLVVSHGDFSPRNVLEADDRVVLIDFDRLQMAGPGRDVGYLGAWCWATIAQGGGQGDWAIGEAFAAFYRLHGGLAISDRAMRFHRACGLLRIAQSWSALADSPDVALRIIDEAVDQLRLCR